MQPIARAAGGDSTFVPLFRGSEHKFQGPLPGSDFLFRLPESIRLEEGSRLVIKFRASPLLMSDVSTATVSLNGNPITSIRLPGEKLESGKQPGQQTLEVPLPPGMLKSGWNRVGVRCLLQTTPVPCRDVDNPACWLTFEGGSGIALSFSRIPLHPDLGRFPDSLAEEQLLRQEQLVEGFPADKIDPVVSVLVPEKPSDAWLRGALVVSSRLGQPGYLMPESVRAGSLADWNRESQKRNGIAIGLPADLATADLPAEAKSAMAALKPGEGFLMEILTGNASQYRWILVSGGDEEGLAKAVSGLGSREFLDESAENPRTVATSPEISAFAERLAQPFPVPQNFALLNAGALTLRGTFRSQAALNYYLPPGFETDKGALFLANLSDSGGLTQQSAIQFVMNGTQVGGIPLTTAEIGTRSVKFDIPQGIVGRDPSVLTINAYLDIGTTDCSHRNEERAWVSLDADSEIELATRPVRIDDLGRFGQVLLRDAFLRRAAVLVPAGAPDGLQLVKAIGLYLGRALPSMPVLWPEAAFYGDGRVVPSARVDGRSVLLLGGVSAWRSALPAGTLMSLGASPESGKILFQSKPVPVSEIPADLVFAEFFKSPWSPSNCVVAVGSASGLGGKVAEKLITSPEIHSKLGGTVAGSDSAGRTFTYDARIAERNPIDERIRERLPAGLSKEETNRSLKEGEYARDLNFWRNVAIACASLFLVALVLAVQVSMISRRKKERLKNGKDETES